MVRKSKTIQQDKLRSFESSFLANMLQDFFHNLEKHKVIFVSANTKSDLSKAFILAQAALRAPPEVALQCWPMLLPSFGLSSSSLSVFCF